MSSNAFMGLVAVFTILGLGAYGHKENALVPQAFGKPRRSRCLLIPVA
jgi:hypothetical protein